MGGLPTRSQSFLHESKMTLARIRICSILSLASQPRRESQSIRCMRDFGVRPSQPPAASVLACVGGSCLLLLTIPALLHFPCSHVYTECEYSNDISQMGHDPLIVFKAGRPLLCPRPGNRVRRLPPSVAEQQDGGAQGREEAATEGGVDRTGQARVRKEARG